jgi:reactive chlorine resistance protein C
MDAVAKQAPATRVIRANPIAVASNATRTTLDAIGAGVIRYGLAVVLLWIGPLKFTAAEAAAIEGLVAHSPFMAWLYRVFSVQGASNLIGMVEVSVALLLAVNFLSSRASFVGSLGAILTFAAATSFLFSTPRILQHGLILSGTGQFLKRFRALLMSVFQEFCTQRWGILRIGRSCAKELLVCRTS